ncbi:MAG: DUF6054 family protein [Anaerorhabdus sp.]|uniref:DUF6054 family protein n=1 Tax=Anaerorhabdus sp. TaxID=1872524 RepID=UPI003A8AED01
MAKFEREFKGDFDKCINIIEEEVIRRSSSSSLEGKTFYCVDDVKVGVCVFERYSMIGSNRVSLNVTLIGKENDLFISAISSGGSQAILFKINTFGEEAFLSELENIIKDYINGQI